MPIATGVMLLTNVGLAIFNNWRGANNSKELQQKQREFQKAAQERNHERMKQLLREGLELNRKIEEELHQNRLENIERDFDSLINRIFAADDINTWPLKVLPMVMKNESLGSAFAHQEESVALHCILTPSNNSDFNKFVFPQLEREVEAFCNSNLTSLSSHPVIFYGGAWKSGTAPKGHEIDQLVADLPNLPMLLITPFFKPNNGGLTFHITTWGMCERQFMEIVPTTQFDYDYTDTLEYTDDVVLNSVEQFSAYLESLIGYLSDIYFLSLHNATPIFPLLKKNKAINTDGMNSLPSDIESNILQTFSQFFNADNLAVQDVSKLLLLYEGLIPSLPAEEQETILDKILRLYLIDRVRNSKDDLSTEDLINKSFLCGSDISFLEKYSSLLNNRCGIKNLIENKIGFLKEIDFDYSLFTCEQVEPLLRYASDGNAYAYLRLWELYEYSIGVKADSSLANDMLIKAYQTGNRLAKLCYLTKDYTYSSDDIEYLLYLSDVKIEIADMLLGRYYFKRNIIDLAISFCSKEPCLHLGKLVELANILVAMGDYKGCVKVLSNPLNSNNVKAQELLGDIYGQEACLNPSLHFKYIEKAMLLGSVSAKHKMGLCFLKGLGTQKSPSAAMLLIKQAADAGYPESMRLIKLLNTI